MIRNTLYLMALLLFSSCNKFYDEIEIESENIQSVEKSMMIISRLMNEKVIIDSISINARIDKLKEEDTLKETTDTYYENWDYKAPKHKSIYITKDSTIYLHYVEIAKNPNEFSKKFESYNDFKKLSSKEKKEFLKSFKVLKKNNIWSCWEAGTDGVPVFVFRYSKDNLYYSTESERYLFLKKDLLPIIKTKEFTDEYEFLDEKGEIVLYKGKRS